KLDGVVAALADEVRDQTFVFGRNGFAHGWAPLISNVLYLVFAARRRALCRMTSVMSSTPRISNGPALVPGCFDINSTAWSISRASSTRMPPSTSLVSANGPSVTTGLPLRDRTVLAC